MREVKALVERYVEAVRAYRRDLHRHPELSGQERSTAAYIADALRGMGLSPREHVGGYGVSALIEGAAPGRCVALRADIDALQITERTGAPFASETPGVMHACGHDAHAAMLLGAAHVLCDLREQFSGCVKLIFQGSEEDVDHSGAKAMIADGVLEAPHVDAVYAQHVWPALPVGTVGVRGGVMMAAADRFLITIRGKSSHGGAAPEKGVDAIVIAAYVIAALQTIVSRGVSPLDSAVISIGKIEGGTKGNIIADEVRMEGTCRNLNPTLHKTMPDRIGRLVRGVAESMGGTAEVDYRWCNPPAENDPEQAALVSGVVAGAFGAQALVVPENGALAGEDFSFFCRQAPACFWWLGCGRAGEPEQTLHSGDFLPQEEALPVGVELLVRSALRFLAQ